jgi:uncharacterized membrane protein YhaH (DUF805 family)
MKDLISPYGKADIAEWWVAAILANVVTHFWGIILVAAAFLGNDFVYYGIMALGVVPLVLSWTVIAVSIRRLRDRGRPPWTIILGLIPIAGWIWLLIECGFLPSKAPEAEHEGEPNQPA